MRRLETVTGMAHMVVQQPGYIGAGHGALSCELGDALHRQVLRVGYVNEMIDSMRSNAIADVCKDAPATACLVALHVCCSPASCAV